MKVLTYITVTIACLAMVGGVTTQPAAASLDTPATEAVHVQTVSTAGLFGSRYWNCSVNVISESYRKVKYGSKAPLWWC